MSLLLTLLNCHDIRKSCCNARNTIFQFLYYPYVRNMLIHVADPIYLPYFRLPSSQWFISAIAFHKTPIMLFGIEVIVAVISFFGSMLVQVACLGFTCLFMFRIKISFIIPVNVFCGYTSASTSEREWEGNLYSGSS